MAVNGVTLRYILYDILRDFKQRYSQADISEYQIVYWILIHADRLRKLHIEKRDSGEYLSIFDVVVNITSGGRKYITLPARIYDFDIDKGIDFITYEQRSTDAVPIFSQVTFGRTTPSKMKRLSYREEETPSPDNPYFYRVGDTLPFIGVEDVPMPNVEVGLFTSLNPTDTSLDIDQAFDFPQDLVPLLKRQVLDLGLFLLQVPKDLLNDGVDTTGAVPQKKLVSVNDLNEQTSI